MFLVTSIGGYFSANCTDLYKCNNNMKMQWRMQFDLSLPVPMPLSTAPSLTPEALVLLVGALWGAKLGRNRHLYGTTEDRLIAVICGSSCNRYKICCRLTRRSYCRKALLQVCWITAAAGLHPWDKLLGKVIRTYKEQCGNSSASRHRSLALY